MRLVVGGRVGAAVALVGRHDVGQLDAGHAGGSRRSSRLLRAADVVIVVLTRVVLKIGGQLL